MKFGYFVVILALCLISCSRQPVNTQCIHPMINIGSECCLDKNNNLLCDDLEPKTNLSNKTEHADIKSHSSYNETKIEEQSKGKVDIQYPSLKEIQSGINQTYYPLKRYKFTNYTDKYNLTGIENTFNVSGAQRFYILKIKKEHNYLNSEKNFSDFVRRLYDLRVKNNQIWDQSHIDSKKQSVYGWEDVISRYDHSLEKVDVMGEPAFLEKHYEIFDQKGNLKQFYLEYKIILWCTPDKVVVIYPSDKFGFYYTIGSFVETEIRYVNGLLKDENKNMIEDAVKIKKICKGATEAMNFGSNEAVFYGMDGFYPREIRLKGGQNLKINNENDDAAWDIFTIIEEKSRKVIISDQINYTNYGEVKLNDSGNYTLFEPEYNGRLRIIVE